MRAQFTRLLEEQNTEVLVPGLVGKLLESNRSGKASWTAADNAYIYLVTFALDGRRVE